MMVYTVYSLIKFKADHFHKKIEKQDLYQPMK